MNLFRSAFLAVALCGLVGCAGMDRSLLEGGLSPTATIANPVTLEQQAGAEASYNIAANAVLAYARRPRCKTGQTFLKNGCSEWGVVQKLKTANRAVKKNLDNLRRFADTDQVSAITAYNALVGGLRDLRAIAFVNGIEIAAK